MYADNAQFTEERSGTAALSRSELTRLLQSLHSTEGLELVRSVAERMLHELIEAEAAAKIGAEWNERTDTRANYRNGHRDKTLTTQTSDLAIPKLRTGELLPGRPAAQHQLEVVQHSAQVLFACTLLPCEWQ